MYLLIFLILFSFEAKAKLSLYEYGVAVGGGYISDYPAADQGRTRTLYFPTFRYRGDLFRSDDKGTRALFFKSKDLDIDLSFGASFPANSEDNKAREDMDDLNWLGEIGPRLNYQFFKNDNHKIELEIPVRHVLETDFKFTREQGFRIVPQVDYTYELNNNYKLNFSVKSVWATEMLNDYFYEVHESDVRKDRERYNANAGHISYSSSAFLMFESSRLFCLGGIRFSNYANSANTESPLHRVDTDTAVFFVMNFFFYQSEQLEN